MAKTLNSPIVSVTSGAANAFGAWTSIWTPPIPLEGIILSLAATSYGLINVGYGSNQRIIANNIWLANAISGITSIPIRIDAGQTLYAQTANASASVAMNIAMLGVVGKMFPDDLMGYSLNATNSVGLTNGSAFINNYGAGVAQLTNAPILSRAKRIFIQTAPGGSPIQLNVGYGPSTSLTTTVAENILVYGSGLDFPCEIPAGNNIFVDIIVGSFLAMYYLT